MRVTRPRHREPRHRQSRRRAVLIAACGIGLVAPALAQETEQTPPPCTSDAHRQFDFWVGDWEVVNTANGEVAGSNSIHPIMEGCALEENWQGASGGRGTSLNVFNPLDGSWYQTWISQNGFFLQLKGGMEDDSMVMSGEMTGRQGGMVLHEIRWTPQEDGDVRQVWRTSTDGGENWNLLFDGTYRRKPAEDSNP